MEITQRRVTQEEVPLLALRVHDGARMLERGLKICPQVAFWPQFSIQYINKMQEAVLCIKLDKI